MAEYLIDQYMKMIQYVDKSNIHKFNSKDLTTQFFSKGSLYNGKLMIVGRAVNGWSETWQHGFFVQESPFKMVSEAYQRSLVEPLTWVNYFWGRNEKDEKGNKCYNTAVSRFWQLAKELIYRLTPQEQLAENRWAETIVWSNLYKVAPNEGGNPNEPLCRAQLEYCRNILKHEIEITTPQYVLFVTDNDWFRDFKDIVDSTGCKYQVCKRPERNSPSLMADEIIDRFLKD